MENVGNILLFEIFHNKHSQLTQAIAIFDVNDNIVFCIKKD